MREKTAFISVYDKTGAAEFARALLDLGYSVYSYGSTHQELAKSGVDTEEVKDKSGMHYAVIEAIRKGSYQDGNFLLRRPDIVVTDVLKTETLEEDIEEAVNSFDSANSNLIRFATKKFDDILVVCDREDYSDLIDKLKIFDEVPYETKKIYASKALNLLAYYEAAVSQLLFNNFNMGRKELVMSLKKTRDLRYGENPHQKAALFSLSGAREWGLVSAKILKGESMNLNHYLDLNVSHELAGEIGEPACAISKHGNISAAAINGKLSRAFLDAITSDKSGSFGGVCSFNRPVDKETAEALSENYIECVSAPDFEKEALEVLGKKEGFTCLKIPSLLLSANETESFSVSGGLLIQEKDALDPMKDCKTVTSRKPTMDELRSLKYAAVISKHTRTYSALLFCENRTVAVSGSQPSVYDSVKILVEKIKYKNPLVKIREAVLAVNGALNLKAVSEISGFGVSAIVQPGNWTEDGECVRFCNEKNIAMLFTSHRHFRH